MWCKCDALLYIQAVIMASTEKDISIHVWSRHSSYQDGLPLEIKVTVSIQQEQKTLIRTTYLARLSEA